MKSIKLLKTFTLGSLLVVPATVLALQDDPIPGMHVQGEMKMTLLEEAAEFESLNVALLGHSSGTINVQACETCPPLALKITPQTKLIVADKEELLRNVVQYRSKPGVAFFQPGTSKLTRIKIY